MLCLTICLTFFQNDEPWSIGCSASPPDYLSRIPANELLAYYYLVFIQLLDMACLGPGLCRIPTFLLCPNNWKVFDLKIVPDILTHWSLLGQECAPPKVQLTPFLLKNMMRNLWEIWFLSTSWILKTYKEWKDLWNQIFAWRIPLSPWIRICLPANQHPLFWRGQGDIYSPGLEIVFQANLHYHLSWAIINDHETSLPYLKTRFSSGVSHSGSPWGSLSLHIPHWMV